MLAQVFGSTVNSQTTNTFFTSTFLNALQSVLITNNTYSLLIAEGELTVGAALVPIVAAVAGKAFKAALRNTSAAGANNIRIGSAPSFAPGAIAGMLLTPGDFWVIDQFNFALNAIADGAGRTLSVFILRTP
jgi:hypothetical protein